MQVQGKYKRFWGSDQWSVKIDFSYELAKTIQFESLLVEFKNDKNGLFNSFEVTDLCSCINLMMKFADGFGIAVFNQRLVSFMEEYFNEHGVEVEAKTIRKCLKKDVDEKIDVKVKKLTIVDKTFTDILEYNPEDLIVDFEDYYKDKNWVIGEKNQLYYPLVSNYSYNLANKKIEDTNQITIENKYNGNLDVFLTLINDKKDILSNITINQVILPEFKPLSVNASLIAPDRTVLGVFQPLEIHQGENGLNIVWKIDELKINHRIEIEFVLLQRVPFKLKLQTNEGRKNYVRYFDISSSEKNQFSIELPALMTGQNFIKTSIEDITALFPIELETQTILYLYPHYILKIIDLGFFQRITFSELFIEALFYHQIKLEGNILPVLTLYESFIPQIGAKLIKKIFRNHSYTNPIVMYNLETSSSHTFEITEEYPSLVNVNLFTLGNQNLHEVPGTSLNGSKTLRFFLNATNDTILFSLLANNLSFDLEKALISVKDTSLTDNYEIFQSINVESIVDQTNKSYLDFKNFKIKSDTESNKIRLRSYSLKINEKERELESNINPSELDKAFETLKQTESLAALKDKIKASYSTSFATNSDKEDTQPTEASVSMSLNTDSTETNQKGAIIVTADDSNDENKTDLDELDAFISDFDGETEQESEQPIENVEEQMQELEKISHLSPKDEEMVQQELGNVKSESIEAEETATASELSTPPILEEEIKKIPKEEKLEKHLETIPTTKGKRSKKKRVEEVNVKEVPSLEIKVIFEKFITKENISQDVLDSEDKIVFMNKDEKVFVNSEEKERPTKTFLKIPRDDRFLILLLNPNENLSAHIYGRWKPQDPLTYKVLLSQTKGLWHIRIQLLESGQTYDLDFKI